MIAAQSPWSPLIVLALLSCDGTDDVSTGLQPVPRTESLGQPLDAAQFDLIGAGVVEGPALLVGDVLADAANYVGKPLRIEGEIVAVSQSERFWITIGDSTAQLRVEFSAPRPPDAGAVTAGRRALVEGVLEHGDAGLSTAELHLVATGAAVRR